MKERPVAYYNEIDPYAAQWLRNLIAAGHIAPGDVDERSIEDVKPDDLRNYTQCHFFAGIGVWSYALRNAGWPDDKPVWTGSCPCQPFSAAGKGSGFDDERHLWPAFHWLIGECRPQYVFGEQVASGNANAWFDLVQADLEAMDYAFGLVPFPSAGVGAPHIRDRAYWVAHANNTGLEGRSGMFECSAQFTAGARSLVERLADTHSRKQRQNTERIERASDVSTRRLESSAEVAGFCGDMHASPVNGFWRNADWLFCRDEKWRPVRPGSFPLVDGATARVGRLRAYGNAINAEAAKVFIAAYLESQHGKAD
ncbi:DNA cytosine methyltransferase [Serratia marcescens]|uniref:DNA cytosine methyltransferase n=1 Tax=Serratia marcescens TaxID=615 RepID=UPI00313C9AE2